MSDSAAFISSLKMSSYDVEQTFSLMNQMKTEKRYLLSDNNLRDILFVKTCYQNMGFYMKEFVELYMDKKLEYNNVFEKTKTTFEQTTEHEDCLLNVDTCQTIMQEHIEEETMGLWNEEDQNDDIIIVNEND